MIVGLTKQGSLQATTDQLKPKPRDHARLNKGPSTSLRSVGQSCPLKLCRNQLRCVKLPRQAVMVDRVDDWVLDTLGKTISSRGELVALCLVSKRFNAIFTPHLYRRLWLDNVDSDNLSLLSTLSYEQHMKNSRDFYLGYIKEGGAPHLALSPRKARLLLQSLLRAKNLRSFTYVETFCFSPVICVLMLIICARAVGTQLYNLGVPVEPEFNGDDIGVNEENEADRPRTLRSIDHLASLPYLQELKIVNVSELSGIMEWRLPLFRNLRTLIVWGMDYRHHRSPDNMTKDIAEIILHSPQLQILGLSFFRTYILNEKTITDLYEYYARERRQRSIERLHLSELQLGQGFFPRWIVNYSLISELTDLAALETLYMDNSDLDIPILHNHLEQWINDESLTDSLKLRCIKFYRFSEDALHFTRSLLHHQPKNVLNEIHVSDYSQLPPSFHYEIPDDWHMRDADLLSKLGLYNWRKIVLRHGIHPPDWPILETFISMCVELEELIIPIVEGEWRRFHLLTLPKLKKLHTLIIVSMFRVERWLPTTPSTRLTLAKEENSEPERVKLVMQTFKENIRAKLRDPNLARLKYFGLGMHIYSCILAPMGEPVTIMDFEAAQPDSLHSVLRYRVLKLSREEALSFDWNNRIHHLH